MTQTPDALDQAKYIEKSRETATNKAIAFCLGEITKRFGSGSPDELPFHTREHSELVKEFGTDLLILIREADPSLVSDNDIANYQIAAAAHDIVQNADFKPNDQGRLTRYRRRGWKDTGNEKDAAAELSGHLSKYHLADGTPVFPDSHIIAEPIATTYPEFSAVELGDEEINMVERFLKDDLGADFWQEIKDKKHLKITQPELTPDSSLAALVLGQADLRAALCSGPHFTDSGNNEFREINTWIPPELAKGIDNIAPETKTAIAGEIKKWMQAQVGVALWQAALFFQYFEKNNIIKNNSQAELIKEKIKQKCLPNIRQNIQALTARHHQLENVDPASIDNNQFSALILQMGYQI